jgi:hypothetical protein
MTTDTAQLLIFIRGIDATCRVREELGGSCSGKGTTAGEEFFLKIQKTLASLEVIWEKLENCTNRWWEKHVVQKPL